MKKILLFLLCCFVPNSFAQLLLAGKPSLSPYRHGAPSILVEIEAREDLLSNECRRNIQTLRDAFNLLGDAPEPPSYLAAFEMLERFVSMHAGDNDDNTRILIALARCRLIAISSHVADRYNRNAIWHYNQMAKEYKKSPIPAISPILLEAQVNLGIELNRNIASGHATEIEKKKYRQIYHKFIGMMEGDGFNECGDETAFQLARFLLWGCPEEINKVEELKAAFVEKYQHAGMPQLQECVAYGLKLLGWGGEKRIYTDINELQQHEDVQYLRRDKEYNYESFLTAAETYKRLFELFSNTTNERIQFVLAKVMYDKARMTNTCEEQEQPIDIALCREIQKRYSDSKSAGVQFYVLASMLSEAALLPPDKAIRIYNAAIEEYGKSNNKYIVALMRQTYILRLSAYRKRNDPGGILFACCDLAAYRQLHPVFPRDDSWLDEIDAKFNLYSSCSPSMGHAYLKSYINKNKYVIGMEFAVDYALGILEGQPLGRQPHHIFYFYSSIEL